MDLQSRSLVFASILVIAIVVVSLRSVSEDSYVGSIRLMPPEMVILSDPSKVLEWSSPRSTPKPFGTVWPATLAPLVVDQGQWGSCTAFAMRYAYMLWLARQNLSLVEPSTAFWYAKSRQALSSAALSDRGSTNSATVSVVLRNGVPSEAQWPYTARSVFTVPPSFAVAQVPGIATAFKRIPAYAASATAPRWQNQAEAFVAEIDAGRSILVAFNVYSNMMTNAVLISGVIPMPAGSLKGGHAVCLIGYVRGSSPANSVFTFYNSWGLYSGGFSSNGSTAASSALIPGLFSIPWAYIANSSISGDWWSL